MIKKTLLLIFIFLFIGFGIYIFERPVSRNFRHSSETTSLEHVFSSKCRKANWEGGVPINASGSGHPIMSHITKEIEARQEPTYIFNTAFDDHDTLYVGDKNLKWYYGLIENDGKLQQARKGFIKRLRYKARQAIASFQNVDFYDYVQEKKIFFGFDHVKQYYRINPAGWLNNFDYIDTVIEKFDEVPDNAHVYIHCNRGKGRTSTFLTLYDIYKNHAQVSLDDIITRQYCRGGEDLNDVALNRFGTWKPEALIARRDMVHHFYAYMNDPEGYAAKTKWSAWIKQKEIQNNADLQDYKKDMSDPFNR